MTASRFSFRGIAAVALQQIALGALLSLLAVGWLHIPDANVFEVAASVVLALLIIVVAGAGESMIALRLTERTVTVRRLLLGAGVVLVAALLWYLLSMGMDWLSMKDGEWAGYLNSRFPASLRRVFSFEHLYLWFSWIIGVLRWVGAALLAAAAFAAIACNRPVLGLLAIFRATAYWLSLLLLAIVGAVITDALLSWTPGHGLGVEMLSLVLRLAAVIVLLAVSVALLLQAMARAVLHLHSVGTGEPATIQPRTEEIP